MAEQLKIAALQHESTPGDIAASLERIAHYAQLAANDQVDLLLLPEASLTGYNNTLEVTQQLAQSAGGESAQRIADLCRQHKLCIAYGFAERDGNGIFNSVQIIDKSGNRVGLYRKTHLWGELDRTLFTPGKDMQAIMEVEGWQLGMAICYDVEFPEAIRRLAIEGAELVLVPTAMMSEFTFVSDYVVNVRAFENQVFLAYANYCGSEYDIDYCGHSCIVGPDGQNLAKAAKQEVLLIATLDKADITSNRSSLPYHRDRRPELYKPLTTHTVK